MDAMRSLLFGLTIPEASVSYVLEFTIPALAIASPGTAEIYISVDSI